MHPGWVKSQDPDPGSGINNQDIFPRALKTIFLGKYLNSLMRIRDPGFKIRDPESMETIRIRDPG
jgi:hypothetical protein